jgi:hypothetical protein
MLFHKHDCLFHRVDLLDGLVLDHFDVTKVSHYLHKNGLFTSSVRALGNNFDAFGNFVDEVVDVLDLLHRVVENKACVGVDPGFNRLFELRNERLRVDTQPADVHRLLHLGDLTFNSRQVCNLLVENFERGEAGDDALKNLLAHPVEGVKFIVELLVFVVGAGAHGVYFLGEILF